MLNIGELAAAINAARDEIREKGPPLIEGLRHVALGLDRTAAESQAWRTKWDEEIGPLVHGLVIEITDLKQVIYDAVSRLGLNGKGEPGEVVRRVGELLAERLRARREGAVP